MTSHDRSSGSPPDPAKLVQVLSHPLRGRIVDALRERTASPSELASEFDVSLPLLSYHVTRLVEAGMLELVTTTPRRGALEHYYRAAGPPRLSEEEWAALPAALRGALTEAVLRDLGDR
jgi:DNA-binding transcriptional ArsR family regulator